MKSVILLTSTNYLAIMLMITYISSLKIVVFNKKYTSDKSDFSKFLE